MDSILTINGQAQYFPRHNLDAIACDTLNVS